MTHDEYRQSVAIENGEVAALKQDCMTYLHEVEALKARIVWLECEAQPQPPVSDDLARDALIEALTWCRKHVVELCQLYGHPLPDHTLAITDAAIDAAIGGGNE